MFLALGFIPYSLPTQGPAGVSETNVPLLNGSAGQPNELLCDPTRPRHSFQLLIQLEGCIHPIDRHLLPIEVPFPSATKINRKLSLFH